MTNIPIVKSISSVVAIHPNTIGPAPVAVEMFPYPIASVEYFVATAALCCQRLDTNAMKAAQKLQIKVITTTRFEGNGKISMSSSFSSTSSVQGRRLTREQRVKKAKTIATNLGYYQSRSAG